MGQKGSDAAKDAADITLVDDNFSSIVAAVSEGRTVYQNIKKVIYWTLPTNAGEALIIGVALLLGLALPLTPVQILWINLATTITLGVVLAFEPADPRAMSRPPRQVGASLFSGRLIWHTGFVSALFVFAGYSVYLYGNSQGYSIVLCQTLVVNTLVILEIAHLLFVRYGYGQDNDWTWPGHNPVIWPLVAVMVFLQLLVTYTPTAQALFSLEAVSLSDFLLILVVGFAFLVFLEVERRLRHRVFSILHA
jgi:magnesium-transporting ATPase (P-type)